MYRSVCQSFLLEPFRDHLWNAYLKVFILKAIFVVVPDLLIFILSCIRLTAFTCCLHLRHSCLPCVADGFPQCGVMVTFFLNYSYSQKTQHNCQKGCLCALCMDLSLKYIYIFVSSKIGPYSIVQYWTQYPWVLGLQVWIQMCNCSFSLSRQGLVIKVYHNLSFLSWFMNLLN